jgi:hypothetical protein
MNDRNGSYARLRYTATGAVAALAAVGAIAGTVALAASPHAKPHAHAAADGGATKPPPSPLAVKTSPPAPSPVKTPPSPLPVKTRAPQPPVNHQPFLDAIQQLVNAGTITSTEGQLVDREIVAGRVDTQTLASNGFTPAQLQAVQAALGSAKQALAPTIQRGSK